MSVNKINVYIFLSIFFSFFSSKIKLFSPCQLWIKTVGKKANIFPTTRGSCWSMICLITAFQSLKKQLIQGQSTKLSVSFSKQAPLSKTSLTDAKLKCPPPYYLWLITAAQLRKLLCLALLLRKTMSIKHKRVI